MMMMMMRDCGRSLAEREPSPIAPLVVDDVSSIDALPVPHAADSLDTESNRNASLSQSQTAAALSGQLRSKDSHVFLRNPPIEAKEAGALALQRIRRIVRAPPRSDSGAFLITG